MITVKLVIDNGNGCNSDEKIVTISAENWRTDESFVKLLKEFDEKAKLLTHSWNTDGNDDQAFVSIEYIDVKDSRVCYLLNDMLDDFLKTLNK